MEEFKIRFFEEEHPGVAFPAYRIISNEEAATLQSVIAASFFEGRHAKELELLTAFFEQGKVLLIDTLADDFDPMVIVAQEHLAVPEKAYAFFAIQTGLELGYEFSTPDLFRYLYEIWYPPAEDLLIIAGDLSWAMALPHYGGSNINLGCPRPG